MTATAGRRLARPPSGEPQRRPRAGRRWQARWTPYALLVPAGVVLVGVLGYPLAKVVELSFQNYGLFQFISRKADWIGFGNYTAVFADAFFWKVLARTVIFTAANVALTLLVGIGVAVMLKRLGRLMRGLVSTGMVAAWVMPSVTSAIVWQWLFEPEFGVANWLLTSAGLGNFTNTNWFDTSALMAFGVVTLLIVWQAVPFVALSLFAGLTQIPDDLYEAARMDGAGAWVSFRKVTGPMLRPILLLLAILSTIWDFTVFNQIWILTHGGPNRGTVTLGIWTYTKAFGASQFGQGAAIAVVSVLLLGMATAYYVRQLVRGGEVK